MVCFTISATALLLLQQSAVTYGFSNMASTARTDSTLFNYKSFQYEEPDAIMMEQIGGVVPAKPSKPIKTVPSSMSKTKIEKASDDQHDFNYHDVSTVPSSFSKIDRGSASDDQHDANYHTIKTVPSSFSKIDRGSASDDQHDANHHTVKTVPSSFSKIDRGSASDDQHESNHHTVKTVPSSVSNTRRAPNSSGLDSNSKVTSSTANFAKKSCTFEVGQTDPYYE